jgi:hypothetical protein
MIWPWLAARLLGLALILGLDAAFLPLPVLRGRVGVGVL